MSEKGIYDVLLRHVKHPHAFDRIHRHIRKLEHDVDEARGCAERLLAGETVTALPWRACHVQVCVGYHSDVTRLCFLPKNHEGPHRVNLKPNMTIETEEAEEVEEAEAEAEEDSEVQPVILRGVFGRAPLDGEYPPENCDLTPHGEADMARGTRPRWIKKD